MIGKFEELTLLALVRAGPASHAAKVYNALEEGLPKTPQFAALYTALDRLAKKGMVSETKDKDDPRGKRLFTITGAGRVALSEAVRASVALGGYELGLA
ncbi:PadR family transcriptional regulator [Mesorhizobium sp. AR10]|uniref:PadR family transcriptional regulator n=1 Tax=Mesorhizobium sp. AR10 TaxID=2865839 RepID=UPI0021602672|nr:PadR family transcriptional regulator [Mesorhizobium sp. AR10]UVK38903.1 PadR family transcriptional regulator [Mesorhizobium sp. AR10]